ncbi:c-type cytochrome biogenesis protein CcmI, partial [Rhodopseudomonas sp. BR0G17]|nr:c-type cytochrome biogenesis protein CcmI [Rhodopseudomonas sp. BR0G17]
PDEPKARYYLGLAAEQDGRPKDAATIWRAMLEKAPADAPWRPMLQAELARLDGTAKQPALPDGAAAAAQTMSEADRAAMIQGMVAKLAAKLKQNGDDVDGWLRLVRAYMVLGETDKAKSAQSEARQAMADKPDRLKQRNE